MLHIEATIKYAGYDPRELKPASKKRVCCVCDVCGRVRWHSYKDYRDLCHPCAMSSKETRNKMSVSTSGENHPMYGKHHTTSTIKKIIEAKTGVPISDDHKAAISKAISGENNPFFGKHHTEESLCKMSKIHSGKQMGEENPNWKGGASFGKYCAKFNEHFKECVREEFGRVCYVCGMSEESNGKKLCVHHVNYDKSCLCDDVECEFVPLCVSCHTKTNFDRNVWESLIMNVLEYADEVI